ncbi:MAG: hypothetical protein IPK68_14140 [Bdellovibrionales bacterium]|nr:hypothetical protein [Bdellovibrionales bacterium]
MEGNRLSKWIIYSKKKDRWNNHLKAVCIAFALVLICSQVQARDLESANSQTEFSLSSLFQLASASLFGLSFGQVTPKPNEAISSTRLKAAILYHRLAGVRVPIDHPILDEVEDLLLKKLDSQAAALITKEASFYDITVRDFAALMSTREETLRAPLTDFIATVVGATRDQLDARLLLSGDFYYKADPSLATNVPQDVARDLLLSNLHYEAIDRLGLSLGTVIQRVDGQQVIGPQGTPVANPDPAGILTSRGWLAAHAVAGTNRRLVEFTFREFLCIPIEQWADTSSSDARIGRDVDRYPGGSNIKYQTTCKGCHTGMDPLRGAFAQVDFENNRVKFGQILAAGNGENQMKRSSTGVSNKLNANADVFPDGYETKDTSWVNQAVRGSNLKYFGWRGAIQGSGIKSFGTMVSNSRAFSRCIVNKVYSSVCKRNPTVEESQLIVDTADAFENNKYNLKWLFERIAIQGTCLGQ